MKEQRLPVAVPTLPVVMPPLEMLTSNFDPNVVIPKITFPLPTREPMVICEDVQELGRIQTLTPFKHFRAHNQIAFSPFYDSWTPADYHTVWGHAHLYLGAKEILPWQMTVTVICERKPRKVLHHYQSVVQFERLERGHYQSPGDPLVHIVVVRDLELADRNYFRLIRSVVAYQFVHLVYNNLR